MPNIEKLDELVTWAAGEDIKRRAGLPSEWDQHRFLKITGAEDEIPAHCGTACCLAGKTVLDAGAFPVVDIDTLRYLDEDAENVGFVEVVNAVYPDGTEVYVEEEAQRLLELNGSQADQLFHANNDLEDVIDIVNQIKAGDDHPYVDRYADED